jgi:hypothetical protein
MCRRVPAVVLGPRLIPPVLRLGSISIANVVVHHSVIDCMQLVIDRYVTIERDRKFPDGPIGIGPLIVPPRRYMAAISRMVSITFRLGSRKGGRVLWCSAPISQGLKSWSAPLVGRSRMRWLYVHPSP